LSDFELKTVKNDSVRHTCPPTQTHCSHRNVSFTQLMLHTKAKVLHTDHDAVGVADEQKADVHIETGGGADSGGGGDDRGGCGGAAEGAGEAIDAHQQDCGRRQLHER